MTPQQQPVAAPHSMAAVGSAADGAHTQLLQFRLAAAARGDAAIIIGNRGSSSSTSMGRVLPLAWLNGAGRVAPFARLGAGSSSAAWSPSASTDALARQLLSDDEDYEDQDAKQDEAARRSGHTDEWYQQRCIFCCVCRSPVNSHFQKRGTRCQGCRRWVHAKCDGSRPAGGASEHSGDEASHARPGGGAARVGSSTGSSAPFFHSPGCQQLYEALGAVAAAGEQPLPPPRRAFWQVGPLRPKEPEQQLTVRLLDLADVRHSYRDAQRRGSLFKQHTRVQQRLAAAANDAAERAAAAARRGWFGALSGSGNSSSTAAAGSSGGDDVNAAGGKAAVPGVLARRGVGAASALDDFLVVSELLKPLGEGPRDLLEDSYALLTRGGRDGPTCVATFNVYGPGHARLQGLATPAYLRRSGHATRLLAHLEQLLGSAGVQQLAVIIEPEDGPKDEARVAAQGLLPHGAAAQWFGRRLGFKPVGAEQRMLWRRELPEYHKSLVGSCTLLVKPLRPA